MSHPLTTVATNEATIESLIAAASTKEGIDTLHLGELQELSNHFGIEAIDMHGNVIPGVSADLEHTSDHIWPRYVQMIQDRASAEVAAQRS